MVDNAFEGSIAFEIRYNCLRVVISLNVFFPRKARLIHIIMSS
jgi:hypothetical protein